MYIAASTRCFAEMSLPEACEQITELGYDKVELWLDEESDHLKPSAVAADPEHTANHFRDETRLSAVALCLKHDVPMETFRGLTKLCNLLRATQITFPASPLGTPFNSEIDRLRSFVLAASQDGIRLAIKTMTGTLSEDPHTAVELCQSVKGLGISLDPSHYICGPRKNVSFDQVFPYVLNVQLRDTSPDQLQVPVGLGEVDYTRIIAMLRRQNYNRMLTVEILPELLGSSDRGLEMRKLRMLLDTLL